MRRDPSPARTAALVVTVAVAAALAACKRTAEVTHDTVKAIGADEGVAVESARSLALGDHHTCARKTDGTIACWGDNFHGQLGDGTTTERHSPTAVPALSGVVEIAVGDAHTCARKTDGTVACWGWNEYGQLGDGTTIDRLSPAAVLPLP